MTRINILYTSNKITKFAIKTSNTNSIKTSNTNSTIKSNSYSIKTRTSPIHINNIVMATIEQLMADSLEQLHILQQQNPNLVLKGT